MNRLKHTGTALAAMLIIAGVMAGCAAGFSRNIILDGSSGEPEPQTNLNFFGFKYEALNVIAIEDALRRYMDEYPGVSIAYDGIKSPGYFDVLEKRLSTGNADDIFMVDHERVLQLREQGKLADLSDIPTLADFSDLAKSQMEADGVIDYVPTSISAFGLYCNTDLLKKHGHDIPQNLAELEAVCDDFVSKGITPIVANNDISLKTVVIAKAMLPIYQSEDTAREIALLNSGQASISQTLRPGFELAEQMIQKGWIHPAQALETAKTQDDLALFAKGEQPFMLTGAWAASRLRDLKPDFRFEVRPYPIMQDGSVLVVNVDTRVSVNAQSPHVQEAKAFVAFLTRKDVMWEFVDSQSSFSPLKENRLAKDGAIQSIGPYLANGRSVLGSDDNLRFPIWDMTRQCVVQMLQGASAQQAVTLMNELLDAWESAQMEG